MARDLACAVLGWALGAALWIGAGRLPRSMLSDEFGAEGVPRGLAILMGAVATLIAARALWSRRKAAVAHDPEHVALALHARALGIIAIGFAYVLLAPLLGYLPTAAILIAASALYYGTRFDLTLAVVAVAGAALLWWTFAKMLGVSMPAGTIWRLVGA